MPRRHKPPESVHPYRWMVSYADFMTLLFAFFVVLYAASSVNNAKFEKMTQSLYSAFESKQKSQSPIQLDAIFDSVMNNSMVDELNPVQQSPVPDVNLMELVQDTLASDINENGLQLKQTEKWLQLEVPSGLLFEGETSELSPPGESILVRISKAFKQFEHTVRIEVFTAQTSNIEDFQQNPWLLSAQQGASIAQLMVLENLPASRLSVVAYGPFQPIASNDDEEGQSLNQRVLFLINQDNQASKRTNIITTRHLSAKP